MQVSSGMKNNSAPNEPSCTTVTVSFNGVLLMVTGAWRSPYEKVRRESDCKLNLDSSENITQDVVVSTTHALYSRLIAGDSELW
ncbi:uncharacterized protein TNCV_3180501 [Trichonephila clavipes]|nr:uncharacterized protein TNCV_3180501 [Trichonephila clavipes]